MVINKATVVMENWKIPLTPRVELGYSGENDVCEFEVITEPQEGFTYYLELQPLIEEANNILLTPDYVEGRIYVELTTEMLGSGGVKKAQIVAYIDTEDAPIKKSNVFEVEVDASINATKSVESHYQTALSQWAQILKTFNPQEVLAKLQEVEAEVNTAEEGITYITNLACRLYKYDSPTPATDPALYPGIREGDLTIASGTMYYAKTVTSSDITWDLLNGGGTDDYEDLENKPSINSITLSGNKTLDDLGIADKDEIALKMEHFATMICSGGITYPNINTTNRTLTIFYDTLVLLRKSPYYVQLANNTVIDYSSLGSGAVKIYFNVETKTFTYKAYNTAPTSDEVLICAIRRKYGYSKTIASMSCPFTIDGKLYGKVDTDIRTFKADYNKNIKSINHRGYNSIAPENTIPAFKLSRDKGFSMVETDVRWTSDGVPVLLHDDTINRTARNADGTEISQTINISSITYEQALTYDFGIWKSSEYAGTKIPTFKEFLILSRNIGLEPYIELKYGTQAQIEGLVDMVRDCGMQGKVTWISFGANALTHVKNYDSKANLCLICNSVDSTVITNALSLKTSDNEVIVSSSTYTDTEINLCKNADLPMEVWSLWSVQQLKDINSYITGFTMNSLIAGYELYNAFK